MNEFRLGAQLVGHRKLRSVSESQRRRITEHRPATLMTMELVKESKMVSRGSWSRVGGTVSELLCPVQNGRKGRENPETWS
jgi:hypothetical protein